MSEDSGKIEDILYDMLKNLDQKMDDQTERLIKLEVNTDKNTSDLAEHIEGVKQTRKIIAQNDRKYEARFQEIEEPKKTVKNVGKFLKWFFGIVSVVAAAIFGILRLYKLI